MKSSHQKIQCDEEGFLTDPKDWSKSTALLLAKECGINNLTASQWAIIKNFRQYYLSRYYIPAPRIICHLSKMGNNCVNQNFNHTGINAWRLADLPNPGEEIKSYM